MGIDEDEDTLVHYPHQALRKCAGSSARQHGRRGPALRVVLRLFVWALIMCSALMLLGGVLAYVDQSTPDFGTGQLVFIVVLFGSIALLLIRADRRLAGNKKSQPDATRQVHVPASTPRDKKADSLAPDVVTHSVEIHEHHRFQVTEFVRRSTGQQYGTVNGKALVFQTPDPETREERLAVWSGGAELDYLIRKVENRVRTIKVRGGLSTYSVDIFVCYTTDETRVCCINDGNLAPR